jgi:hypothetical protein
VILRYMREAGNGAEALCVEVLLDTGMREGELLEHVQPHQITIETDEDGNENAWVNLYNDETKGMAARRILIDTELARQLKALIAFWRAAKSQPAVKTFQGCGKTRGVSCEPRDPLAAALNQYAHAKEGRRHQNSHEETRT